MTKRPHEEERARNGCARIVYHTIARGETSSSDKSPSGTNCLPAFLCKRSRKPASERDARAERDRYLSISGDAAYADDDDDGGGEDVELSRAGFRQVVQIGCVSFFLPSLFILYDIFVLRRG